MRQIIVALLLRGGLAEWIVVEYFCVPVLRAHRETHHAQCGVLDISTSRSEIEDVDAALNQSVIQRQIMAVAYAIAHILLDKYHWRHVPGPTFITSRDALKKPVLQKTGVTNNPHPSAGAA